MHGAVRRVTRDVELAAKHALLARREPSDRERLAADHDQGNPWGSMPSDALPSLAITARSLGEISTAAGAAGWALTALDAFALVYLGEHYVIDLIVGLALVELIWRGEPLALPLVRAGVSLLRGLERYAG